MEKGSQKSVVRKLDCIIIQIMMNYPTVEEFLYGLHCQLWDIYNLHPTDFSNKALKLVRTGAQPQIVNMLIQGIQNYPQERAILNYLYIVDKLLKAPSFNEHLQTVIVDVYCLIFISLWTQRCLSELEQVKILRKFWLGTIHPLLLQQMKDNIYHRTGIDIDKGFKAQTISSIKDYYQNRLKMTPEQIQFHLPSCKPYNLARTYDDGKYKEEFARRKQTDEETKYPSEQIAGERPRKKVHQARQKGQSHIQILQKLKMASPLSCRECGKRYIDQELLNKHIDEHVMSKIGAFEKNQKNPYRRKEKWRKEEVRMEEWQNGNGNLQPECNKFCIPVRQLYKYKCSFCLADIQQTFKDDEWVCINAVEVQVDNRSTYMHKSCYDELSQQKQ